MVTLLMTVFSGRFRAGRGADELRGQCVSDHAREKVVETPDQETGAGSCGFAALRGNQQLQFV
jgi:hypothetical protein